ncbi:MAG: NAD(P)H-dependent oxidoreductase [Bacteroidales bacterium]|jgi:NAD(P)H dehydrogenase (quinone)|nr:NAD(P)H-dependent oxidoreductase [Bacteroidales bacterium]
MRALIIYANYKEQSFTAAIRDTLAESFHKNGHEVVVRDLYEIKFNPVLSKRDLESIENEIFPIDIMNEQKFIAWADMICFVYPIWWSGMPAILKGYIERVLVQGYAFDFVNDEAVIKLKNKKIAIFNTTGTKNIYQDQKSIDALNHITEQCIFGFVGLETVEHKYFKAVTGASDAEKEAIFNEVRDCAKKLLG